MPRPAFPAVVLTALVAAAGCDIDSDEKGASTERPRETESPGDSGRAPLAERLRRGGYVLAFRHAATDFSTTDTTRDLRDCSRQRNLTAKGRRQARSIGREFRRLGIPVGRVLASVQGRMIVDLVRLPNAPELRRRSEYHGVAW